MLPSNFLMLFYEICSYIEYQKNFNLLFFLESFHKVKIKEKNKTFDSHDKKKNISFSKSLS